MIVSTRELALNLILRIRRSSFIRPSSLVLIFPCTIQLVSVALGNRLTRKFGRTGVVNEQTAILGTTALRSIQGLSKSSLGQARLRIQSRDQSCRDPNHLRTLHGTRLRGVVASSLAQRRKGTKKEPVRGGIRRVFSLRCMTRSALSHISECHDLSYKCALVQGLKALSTGREVQTL